LNSSNDRRGLEEVIPSGDPREHNLQITHLRPTGSQLLPPNTRPKSSTDHNTVGRATVSLISRKARASLFELDGGLVSRKPIYKPNARPVNVERALTQKLIHHFAPPQT